MAKWQLAIIVGSLVALWAQRLQIVLLVKEDKLSVALGTWFRAAVIYSVIFIVIGWLIDWGLE